MTAVSEEIFNILDGVTLRQTSRSLCGPAKHKLVVCGQFTGTCTSTDIQTVKDVSRDFCGQRTRTSFDGRAVIKALHLISSMLTAQTNFSVKLYPDLFTGLGTLGIEYHIQLRHNVKPYTLSYHPTKSCSSIIN